MRTGRTIVAALAALAVGIGSVAIAQPKPAHKPDPKRQEARQQLRQTMLDWTRTAIIPTLNQWKSQLDAAMSAEDLATLNGLRSRAAALRKQGMTHRSGMHQAWQQEDYTALKTHREALRGMREQLRTLLGELKPLAIKYRTTLQQIGETARPQVKEWRNEGKQKLEEWMAAHSEELGDHPLGKFQHGMPWKGWGKMFGMGGEMRKKVAAARFMLWNGDDFTRDLEQIAPHEKGAEDDFNLK